METISKSERHAPYILILILTILASGIVAAGCLYYQNYKKHYRVEVERQLSAIAELKVNELVDWRKERFGDAGIFYKNAAFSALVRRYFEKPDNADAQGQIRTWLSQIQAAHKYDRIMLLDTQYSKKMIFPDSPERITQLDQFVSRCRLALVLLTEIPDWIIVLFNHLSCTISRTIIDYYDFVILICLCKNTIEGFLNIFPAIICRNTNTNFWHI